eukprot:3127111-Amphidinium_carterae.1
MTLRKLRGQLWDLSKGWSRFDPTKFHGVTKVRSGTRVSATLFTPKGWETLNPGTLWRLGEWGFKVPDLEVEADVGISFP